MLSKEVITNYFKDLQDRICLALEQTDGGSTFIEDAWQREEGGGGRTRIIQNGNVLEKGGVAFSAVYGELPVFLANEINQLSHQSPAISRQSLDKSLKSNISNLTSNTFYATGVSIVIHPKSPMVPIIHMNVRYFEAVNDKGISVCWFGGGIDLTPHYVNEEDARFFHLQLKNACDKHDPKYYSKFKTWADDYFFIKHRNETRGIGGIFFDKLTPSTESEYESLFAFVKEVGECFAPTYTHLMKKNATLPFGDQESEWQRLRRGRYVEFNLVLDRGTQFGLQTNGRTESILMSLPPQANWLYNYKPQNGSNEAKTLVFLKKGINWV